MGHGNFPEDTPPSRLINGPRFFIRHLDYKQVFPNAGVAALSALSNPSNTRKMASLSSRKYQKEIRRLNSVTVGSALRTMLLRIEKRCASIASPNRVATNDPPVEIRGWKESFIGFPAKLATVDAALPIDVTASDAAWATSVGPLEVATAFNASA